MYDVLIVGGGAAGVYSAIRLSKAGLNVCLVEQEKELLKKLLKTGNGRCNFTNSYYDDNSYRGDVSLAKSVIDSFSYKDTIEFMNSIGVMEVSKDGYYYPYTNKASSVTKLMIKNIPSSVTLALDMIVLDISKMIGDYYHVTTSYKEFDCKRIIIATGGTAGYFFKNNDSQGYGLATKLGHNITPLKPALTSLKLRDTDIYDWAGIRLRAGVTITNSKKERVSYKAVGEVQLTDYGISGIPVFEVSRYVTTSDEELNVEVDFLPDIDKLEAIALCNQIFNKDLTVVDALSGLFNPAITSILIANAGVMPNQLYSDLSPQDKDMIFDIAKGVTFKITGYSDFDKAQVTAGGIDTTEINLDTLESKLYKNIYFAGEVLDVDGNCGGYNLQFAFASANRCVDAIIKEFNDDTN